MGSACSNCAGDSVDKNNEVNTEDIQDEANRRPHL